MSCLTVKLGNAHFVTMEISILTIVEFGTNHGLAFLTRYGSGLRKGQTKEAMFQKNRLPLPNLLREREFLLKCW